MSSSQLTLPPALPSQATTLMELWNHRTSTPASWKSTSARRTRQICKCPPCSAAGTAFAVVFCAVILSSFQPCNLRNCLEITVPPSLLESCFIAPCSLTYSFPVLLPGSLPLNFPGLSCPLFPLSEDTTKDFSFIRAMINPALGARCERLNPSTTRVWRREGLPLCTGVGKAGGAAPVVGDTGWEQDLWG